MTGLAEMLLQVSLVIFMGGSLFGMGLALPVRDALTGLADVRFGLLVLLLGFVVSPAVALALAWLFRLDDAYATGLVLLGMAPCAPFLSTVVERAGGDRTRCAALLLIAAAATILLLPVAVPVVIPGLAVDAWSIAQPLLLLVVLPLGAGMVLLRVAPGVAAWLAPLTKRITGAATVVLLLLCAVLYGEGFLDAIGSRAIAAQVLFFALLTGIAYAFGARLPPEHRSVLTLGITTRNVGAALAPLFAVAGSDERSVVMIVLGVPLQMIFAYGAARRMSARKP